MSSKINDNDEKLGDESIELKEIKKDIKDEMIKEEEEEENVDKPLLDKPAENVPIRPKNENLNDVELHVLMDNSSPEEQVNQANDEKEDENDEDNEDNDENEDTSKQTESLEDRIRKYLGLSRAERYKKLLIIGLLIIIVVGIGALLYYGLIPIQYDQLALTRSLITGRLYSEKTYKSGRHFIMPWNEIIIFKREAHQITYKNLRILTRDKLEVFISTDVFYFINPDQLGQLYRNFNFTYENIVARTVRSAILNEGQQFSINDYRTERAKVLKVIKNHLVDVFAKKHCILFNLFIKSISFGSRINDLNLKRVLNNIYNEKELFTKKTAITLAETNLLINNYKNSARYTIANATYKSNILIKSSQIDFNNKIELIHNEELNKTLNELNFKNTTNKQILKQRISYIYFYSLINHKNLHVYSLDYLQKNMFIRI